MRSRYQSLILARQALALDPDCVDALLARAYLMPTPEERRSMYRQAIRAGERTLGPAFMEAAKGDFWGLIETRPYMRALHALADDLGSEGRFDEAVPLCERMLELNPNDNQGVRFQLFALYLATDRLDEAARLDERFPDDATAFFTWGRVLLHYLQGNEQRALQALRKARGWNPHVEAYLTGKRKLDPSDQPNYYSIGDENEAYLAAEYLLPAWVRHPDAVAWLKKQSGRAPRKP
jgi:tetratricopeptide (TPR) repeat protein